VVGRREESRGYWGVIHPMGASEQGRVGEGTRWGGGGVGPGVGETRGGDTGLLNAKRGRSRWRVCRG